MPKTLLERIIFTTLMATLMVYAMICYNVAIEMGHMSNEVFAIALQELVIMLPIAFICELSFVGLLAKNLAFKIVDPRTDRPIVVTWMISIMIVCIMCPIMSFVATLLFANAGSEFIAVWFEKIILNFPMALGFQLIIAGPIVRTIFKTAFNK